MKHIVALHDLDYSEVICVSVCESVRARRRVSVKDGGVENGDGERERNRGMREREVMCV